MKNFGASLSTKFLDKLKEVFGNKLHSEKILTANITTDTNVSDLTITGLTVGKRYEVRLFGAFQIGNGDPTATLAITHDGVIGSLSGGNQAASPISFAAFANPTFIATTTTITFDTSSFSGTTFLRGNGTKGQTYVQVHELNNWSN